MLVISWFIWLMRGSMGFMLVSSISEDGGCCWDNRIIGICRHSESFVGIINVIGLSKKKKDPVKPVQSALLKSSFWLSLADWLCWVCRCPRSSKENEIENLNETQYAPWGGGLLCNSFERRALELSLQETHSQKTSIPIDRQTDKFQNNNNSHMRWKNLQNLHKNNLAKFINMVHHHQHHHDRWSIGWLDRIDNRIDSMEWIHQLLHQMLALHRIASIVKSNSVYKNIFSLLIARGK